jgi:hypothetical protein
VKAIIDGQRRFAFTSNARALLSYSHRAQARRALAAATVKRLLNESQSRKNLVDACLRQRSDVRTQSRLVDARDL